MAGSFNQQDVCTELDIPHKMVDVFGKAANNTELNVHPKRTL